MIIQKNILNKLVLGFLPLILVWALDSFTKNWAKSLITPRNFWHVHFELIYNHGVIFGFSSQLPLIVKMVALTTLGAMVLSSFTLIVIVAPIRSLSLRLGLSLVVGGIIGNVTDRFIHSAVIDFITIKFNYYSAPIVNLADIFQWIGYICIVFGLYSDSRHYWPTLDLRNNFFINPYFQIRTGLTIGLLSIFTGFTLLMFGLSFFQDKLANENVRFYLIYGSALTIFLGAASFVIGVSLSHRVAGPVYALSRYINDSRARKKFPLKFREHDEFKELENQLTLLNGEMCRLYDIEKKYNEKKTVPPIDTDTILETVKKSS